MTTIEIDFDKYEYAIADILLRQLKDDRQGIITSLGFLHDKLEQDGIENDLHLVKTMTINLDTDNPITIMYPPLKIDYIQKTNKVSIGQPSWGDGVGVNGVLIPNYPIEGSGIVPWATTAYEDDDNLK